MHRLSWPGWKNPFNHSLPSTFSPTLARKNWNAWPCISLAFRQSWVKIGTKRLPTDTTHPLTQRINSQFLTGYRKSSLASISPWFFRRKRNTADSGYGSEQPLDRRWSQEFSQEVRITCRPWSPDNPGGDGQMACSVFSLAWPKSPGWRSHRECHFGLFMEIFQSFWWSLPARNFANVSLFTWSSNESKFNLKIPTTSLWRHGPCFYSMDLIK